MPDVFDFTALSDIETLSYVYGNHYDVLTFGLTVIACPVPIAPAPPPVPLLQYTSNIPASNEDYGSDILTFPDLEQTMTPTSDRRIIAEVLARRLSTPDGTLPFHPDDCTDIRKFLSDSTTGEGLFRIKASVEAECLKDERVLSSRVDASYDSSTGSLSLDIDVETSFGPFEFTLNVTELTIELLEKG